ncbi:fimbrial biogenesis usher protein [Escherichia albertii]
MFKKALLAYSMGLTFVSPVSAGDMEIAEVDFDRETLKSLGVNPNVSHYFSRASRFLPGEYSLALSLNGQKKGNIAAHFDENGDLCLDLAFLQQAGLKVPSSETNGCYNYAQSYPGTIITPLPNQEALEIIVPPQAIAPVGLDMTNITTGGTAGLLNYNLMSSRTEFANESSDYSQAALVGGINFNNWMLRSNQFLTQSNGKFSNQTSSTYLQRTFTDIKTLMRAGEVNLNNSVLEGTSIYGIEIAPEYALQAGGSGVQVTGIANTAQARVEIRQQGMLIHTTLVPVGAFTIPDVPIRNGNSDLDVTVVETDGRSHNYIVPSSLFNQHVESFQGYRFAMGRVDDNYDESPWVFSASGGWNLTHWSALNGGIIVAENYQAASIRQSLVPLSDLTLSSQISSSQDNKDSLRGQKYRLDATYNLPFSLGLTTSIAYSDRNYRELPEAIDDDYTDPTKSIYALSLNWSNELLGGFNISGYKTISYDGDNDATNLNVNWNKAFKHATVSVNWQHQLSASVNSKDDGDLFYVNLSIPFGRSNTASFYTRHDDHKTHYGTGVMGVVSDEMSYYVSAERDHDQRETSVNGSLSTNLHYTQVSLAAGASGSNNRTYNGTMSGGIALYDQGVAFSPWAINDTFAIAKLDKNIAGVKIVTQAGPVWTDFHGNAVIPSLQPWRASDIEIDTVSLPKNMDVGNGTKMIKQSRGTVGKVGFSAITQRRALLTITLLDGKKLPRGIALEDDEGRYLTTSVDEGVIFLNNIKPNMILAVKDEQLSCHIHMTFEESAPEDVFYETATGVCQ